MVNESQNIEWKESWRDEYIKWICGFANAQGGRIYIGTDDNGNVVGVTDSKRLLEDIPNKVRDILGIIVDVNLLEEDEKSYIEIIVNSSSYPVNYKAIYNAIIHSDYSALIPIQIRIHADEVHISNDCVLPVGWTVETLMEKHRSEPHNPNIANAFFRAGYVETWGRGIEKICEACRKHGVPEPEYMLHPGDIMIKFMPLRFGEMVTNRTDCETNATNLKLTKDEERVILLIKDNPSITQKELHEKLGISLGTIKRILPRLQEKDVLVRSGNKRSGKWIIK